MESFNNAFTANEEKVTHHFRLRSSARFKTIKGHRGTRGMWGESNVVSLDCYLGEFTVNESDVVGIANCKYGDTLLVLNLDADIWTRWYAPRDDSRRRKQLYQYGSEPEHKARMLLKRLIGTAAYKKYLTDGFVTYHGNGCKTYTIYPSGGMTKVWFDGENVEALCCNFDDFSIPPTDFLCMRLLLLNSSETDFKSRCDSHGGGFLTPSYRANTWMHETGRMLKFSKLKAEGELRVECGRVYMKRA